MTRPVHNNYSVGARKALLPTKGIDLRVRFEGLKQEGRGDVQGICQAKKIEYRDVTPTFFNLTDVVGAQGGLVRECLLGKPTLLSILANSRTEELQGRSWTSSPFCHGVPIEEIM